jgi:choice-of-anchor C domain-containing protein
LRTRRIVWACAVAALAAGAAPARAEMITNGGFESGPTPPPGVFVTVATGSTDITGWTVTHAPVNVVSDGYWQPVEGHCSLGLNATSAGGGVAQTLTTQPGATYQVRFQLSGEPFTTPALKTLRVSAAGQQQDYTFDTSTNWHWAMGWLPCTWNFVAGTSSTTLELLSLTVGDASPAVDSVSVSLVAVAGVPERPATLALEGPNPVRGGATFTFGLPASGAASLEVSDLSGRRVASLARGSFAAGMRTATWSAADRPAGIYFVTLRAGQRLVTRRITLLH